MGASSVYNTKAMKESKRAATPLPDYTHGEELVNTVTHIAGAVFAIAAIPLLVIAGAVHNDPWAVVSGSIYGAALLIMFTVSSVYHGLRAGKAKRVMRIIDHCDIYFLIAGTYTPILLVSVRPLNPGLAWSVFGVEWALTVIAVTLNAVDLKRYEKISMTCYVGMGWCVIVFLRYAIEAMTMNGFILLLAGGLAFTLGAVMYGVGKKKRYMHSVFHLLVIVGCVLQFLSILFYVM